MTVVVSCDSNMGGGDFLANSVKSCYVINISWYRFIKICNLQIQTFQSPCRFSEPKIIDSDQ